MTILCAGNALSQLSVSDHISHNGLGTVDGIATINSISKIVVDRTHLMSPLTEEAGSSSQFAAAASNLWNVNAAHTILGGVVAVSLLLLEIFTFTFPPGTQLVMLKPLRVTRKGV